MEANIQALQNRAPGSKALARYGEIAQLLSGITAKAADGVEWLRDVCLELKVPPLSESGLKEQDLPTVVAKSQKSSSMKGNPITLTDDELIAILKKSQ